VGPVDRAELGKRGEQAARSFLERCGFEILDTNWRCGRGEIDIVAREDDVLVLVEVKTRRTVKAGTPEEAVSPAKQRRIARLAAAYLKGMAHPPERIRFDVVTIMVIGPDRALLRHHRAAFSVE
jgi:putative endonuclease